MNFIKLSSKLNQKGLINYFPLLIIAVVAILAFIYLSSAGSFRDRLFSTLYARPISEASSNSLFSSLPDCGPGQLQTLINNAAPGSSVSAPHCITRETITINKPLTLIGGKQAEIRGSDVWNDSVWAQNGSFWISSKTVPPLYAYQDTSRCLPGSDNRCLRPEQLFMDGNPLYQSSSNPTSMQFGLDNFRHIILVNNPKGHVIEVTTRANWLIGLSDNVTIRGFTMKHAGNDAQTGGLTTNGFSNWIIQNNTLSDAHGTIIELNKGSNNQIINNDISRGGQEGIGNYMGNTLIQGNQIHDNNTEGFNPGWEAGGVKMASANGAIFDSNDVYNNNAPGLWCDILCQNITYKNNRIYDNAFMGILFEISNGAKIYGNKLWHNGYGSPNWGWGAGIVSSSSSNTQVYNNVLAWNADGISMISQNRSDRQSAIGLNVHDNSIIISRDPNDTSDIAPLGWLQDYTTGEMFANGSNNQGKNNNFWIEYPEPSYCRFQWNGCLTTLADFTATPWGDIGGRYLSDSEKNLILSNSNIPACETCTVRNPNSGNNH